LIPPGEVAESGQAVTGTVSESNDAFTFTPDPAPFPDGVYHVSFTAADPTGNAEPRTFSFIGDSRPPGAPLITGSTGRSGTIQVQPAENLSNTPGVTVTGTREDHTGVWINNALNSITQDLSRNDGILAREGMNEVNKPVNLSLSLWGRV